MKARVHLTIQPELVELAKQQMKARHFANLSDFMEDLLRAEMERRSRDLRSMRMPGSGVSDSLGEDGPAQTGVG